MKRLVNRIWDMLADAALLEMGVEVQTTAERRLRVVPEPMPMPQKSFFRNIVDTLADAADLEMGVQAVLPGERQPEKEIVHPDECQYGDNDMCFRHAA